VQSDLSSIGDRLSTAEKDIEDLKSALGSGGAAAASSESAGDLSDILRQLQALRSDLATTDGVARSADGLAHSNKEEIDDLRNKLEHLKSDLDRISSELANKVDCDEFDSLREAINAAGAGAGSGSGD
jgi:chromosome segregation ATPase